MLTTNLIPHGKYLLEWSVGGTRYHHAYHAICGNIDFDEFNGWFCVYIFW